MLKRIKKWSPATLDLMIIGAAVIFLFSISEATGLIGLLNIWPNLNSLLVAALFVVIGMLVYAWRRRREMSREIRRREGLSEELTNLTEQLTFSVGEMERRNLETDLITQMDQQLQNCRADREATAIFSQMLPEILADTSGTLYMAKNPGQFELVFKWGESTTSGTECESDDCWALRQGRPYFRTSSGLAIPCAHFEPNAPQYSLCVPIGTHGEALGFLAVFSSRALTDREQHLAVSLAEHFGLAVSSLRLRDSLRQQSIRDALTDLFNRRYMEESLEKEISRADRNEKPLGIIMLDLDKFKQFNDTNGHAAGDALLSELGACVKRNIRTGDIACRYGGEEFVIVMPDTSLEVAAERAEKIRADFKKVHIEFMGNDIKAATLSAGVAAFPMSATKRDKLLRAADDALYSAKENGRDRVAKAA